MEEIKLYKIIKKIEKCNDIKGAAKLKIFILLHFRRSMQLKKVCLPKNVLTNIDTTCYSSQVKNISDPFSGSFFFSLNKDLSKLSDIFQKPFKLMFRTTSKSSQIHEFSQMNTFYLKSLIATKFYWRVIAPCSSNSHKLKYFTA